MGNVHSVSVRWQEQMEDHLTNVKMFLNIPSGQDADSIKARAAIAQAHATAATALALANGLGDIETELNHIAHAVADHES